MYRIVPEKLELFNTFFLTHLLPVQQRYGAVLVGRWASADSKVIFALWAYESKDAYHFIQSQVSRDPDSVAAQAYRQAQLEPLFTETEEWLMSSTVPLEVTALSALKDV